MVYNGVIGRTQIYLGEDELAVLDGQARATGASRSELVRRAVRATFGSVGSAGVTSPPVSSSGSHRPGRDGGSHVEIHFTVDDPGTADALVDAVLADRLVACGQRTGPVASRYWWRGSIERAEEWLVVLKTRADLATRVVDAIVGLHPYETPEVVVVDLAGGATGYLAWVTEVTADGIVDRQDAI